MAKVKEKKLGFYSENTPFHTENYPFHTIPFFCIIILCIFTIKYGAEICF